MKTEKEIEEIKKELDKFVKWGILTKKKIKGEFYYKDSEYSKKVDKMNPREAFIEGLRKGKEWK